MHVTAMRNAACQDDFNIIVVLPEIVYKTIRPVFGGLFDATGVENDQGGLGYALSRFVALAFQKARNPLGIAHVHLATKSLNKVVFVHRSSLVPHQFAHKSLVWSKFKPEATTRDVSTVITK